MLRLYAAKGSRVFVSGMVSILIPLYLDARGYGFLLGPVVIAILAGNAVSNVALTYFQGRLGKRKLLLLFSGLMVVAGLLLGFSDTPALILLACFMGNISTTGTEAGPFQSVEAGVLPGLAGESGVVKAFGRYNLIGYAASAVGSFAAGTPGFISGGLAVYRYLFLVFGAVGAVLFVLYATLEGLGNGRNGNGARGTVGLSPTAKREVMKLSALFSLDAFGGIFVSQLLLSNWFHQTYDVSPEGLGAIFFVTNVIVAFSVYGASMIAGRLGNLRTMVYTHVVSNVFLLAIPFAGSLPLSLTFLFVRQSMSQMDVPTRQALMAEMFSSEERVQAYAVTNTARTLAALGGGPVNALLLAPGLLSATILVGGTSKLAYDSSVFALYRKRYR